MGRGIPLIFLREEVQEVNPDLLGPFFLGLIVNYFLWGIQVTQSYCYYRSYRATDKRWMKTAVGLLFAVDAIQSICASEGAWRLMVDGWGDSNKVNNLSWGIYMIPLINGSIASIVHIFYAQKIWTLLDIPFNYIFASTVLSLSCLQLTAGIGCTIFVFAIKLTLPDLYRIKTWSYIWLITASVTDITITAIITWTLSKSRTGYKNTDDIISKLIRLTVETGLTPAIVQILVISFYLKWPMRTYDVFPGIIASKVYSNSMLALLNSRNSRGDGEIWDTQPIDSIQIHTTQTVAVTSDYELDNAFKQKTKSSRSRDERSSALNAESASSFPFNRE